MLVRKQRTKHHQAPHATQTRFWVDACESEKCWDYFSEDIFTALCTWKGVCWCLKSEETHFSSWRQFWVGFKTSWRWQIRQPKNNSLVCAFLMHILGSVLHFKDALHPKQCSIRAKIDSCQKFWPFEKSGSVWTFREDIVFWLGTQHQWQHVGQKVVRSQKHLCRLKKLFSRLHACNTSCFLVNLPDSN